MVNKYKKYISESKNIAYFSILVTIILRLFLWLNTDVGLIELQSQNSGYLWSLIAPHIVNPILSFCCSIIAVSGIGLYVAHLNDRYALIRRRTSLPYVFTIFIFSSYPLLTYMVPQYISVIFLLFAMNILLSAYQNPLASKEGFKIGFVLALGSLFSLDLLLYIPVFWIGLSVMRCFNIKALLASILGVVVIYWLLISYFLSCENLDAFFMPFKHWIDFKSPPILGMSIFEHIYTITGVIVLIVILIDNYANEYKDKIRVRANFNFFNLIVIYSLLSSLFISTASLTYACITFVVSALILAHFFALADKRWKIYLFYFLILFYASTYLYYISQ